MKRIPSDDEIKKVFIGWEEQGVVEEGYIYMMDVFGGDYWADIAEEGLRVLNVLTDDSYESDCLVDCIIGGVAAQAQTGAFNMVANMLGLDPEAFEYAVESWTEDSTAIDPKLRVTGIDVLMRAYQEGVEHKTELRSQRLNNSQDNNPKKKLVQLRDMLSYLKGSNEVEQHAIAKLKGQRMYAINAKAKREVLTEELLCANNVLDGFEQDTEFYKAIRKIQFEIIDIYGDC